MIPVLSHCTLLIIDKNYTRFLRQFKCIKKIKPVLHSFRHYVSLLLVILVVSTMIQGNVSISLQCKVQMLFSRGQRM